MHKSFCLGWWVPWIIKSTSFRNNKFTSSVRKDQCAEWHFTSSETQRGKTAMFARFAVIECLVPWRVFGKLLLFYNIVSKEKINSRALVTLFVSRQKRKYWEKLLFYVYESIWLELYSQILLRNEPKCNRGQRRTKFFVHLVSSQRRKCSQKQRPLVLKPTSSRVNFWSLSREPSPGSPKDSVHTNRSMTFISVSNVGSGLLDSHKTLGWCCSLFSDRSQPWSFLNVWSSIELHASHSAQSNPLVRWKRVRCNTDLKKMFEEKTFDVAGEKGSSYLLWCPIAPEAWTEETALEKALWTTCQWKSRCILPSSSSSNFVPSWTQHTHSTRQVRS